LISVAFFLSTATSDETNDDRFKSCIAPPSPIGTTLTRGCRLYQCWRGVWKLLHKKRCCYYMKKRYKIGKMIKTVVGEDGCSTSSLDCTENVKNKAIISISVSNNCSCGTTTTTTSTTTTSTTTTAAATSCDAGWDFLQSNCYSVQTQNLSWTNAQSACESLGGDLASVTSNGVMSLLFNLQNEVDVWIGGNDLQTQETFEWVNGDTWSYENWNTNQPNHLSGQDCVKYKKNTGKWDDVSCDKEFMFACQKPPLGTFISNGENMPSVFVPF